MRIDSPVGRAAFAVVGVGVIAFGAAFVWPKIKTSVASWEAGPPDTTSDLPTDYVQLSPSRSDTIRFTKEGFKKLAIETVEVQPAPPPEPLRLPGSLLLDPNGMVRIHSRFPGELVQLGTAADPIPGPDGQPRQRPLRYGDRVHKTQLLAVVWSKDVGEKKSEMIDALSKLDIDQSQLNRLMAVEKGVVPERQILDAQRNMEGDLIAVAKAERTLRSWRLTDEEIAAIRREARDIQSRKPHSDKDVSRTWAETEVRSPIDGLIVEKNYNVGDILDNTQDIFKIADLSHIQVLANAYEEDLPVLRALPPEQRQWKIDIKSDPNDIPVLGRFDLIGNIIDPNQHSGAVMGWLANPDGKLSVGQFITATIDLPPDPGMTSIPASALIEEGERASVFVEANRDYRDYWRRPVAVVRRGRTLVYIRAEPDAQEKQNGAVPLHAGERVITARVLELSVELDELKAAAAGH
jgi:membrane fusion protein, heavy metal efflux system